MFKKLFDGRIVSCNKKTGGMVIQDPLWGDKEPDMPSRQQGLCPYHPEMVDMASQVGKKGVKEDKRMTRYCLLNE